MFNKHKDGTDFIVFKTFSLFLFKQAKFVEISYW